ncbi:Metallo-hydrolase/oxidoreductase [Hyaloscypha hepaticicola]|uniref:Metallo-hydrolase/oxidoreductase n=1 Tax=Hyaloscypha hepaticicola TaxID=2082293 RepID=A0A2J6QKS0_9HELO|nr:Metallo-hydrolase/oxidoreductase [Hyaloscypha hepaticicola]
MESFPPAFLAPLNQNYVTVHALSAGSLTLPEHLFMQPSVGGASNTVPSLAFLIQHYDTKTSKLERILFDLGLRKDLKQYPVPLQEYLESRQPLITEPDVSDSLAAGGLKPDDIDYVILSHVHWDHVGMPSDFKSSQFIVGSGSLALLELGRNPLPAESNSYFEADLLPVEMTTELPGVHQVTDAEKRGLFSDVRWKKLGTLPNVIDVFSDGSLYLVDSPGHLDGHLNLLARLGPRKLLYLAGDACHDRRIMRGELEIGMWKNLHGEQCCVHVDKEATLKTIELIARLEKMGVEVVLAHDSEWLNEEGNKKRFWPGKM